MRYASKRWIFLTLFFRAHRSLYLQLSVFIYRSILLCMCVSLSPTLFLSFSAHLSLSLSLQLTFSLSHTHNSSSSHFSLCLCCHFQIRLCFYLCITACHLCVPRPQYNYLYPYLLFQHSYHLPPLLLPTTFLLIWLIPHYLFSTSFKGAAESRAFTSDGQQAGFAKCSLTCWGEHK